MPPATPRQPLALIVLDGWGYSDNLQYNAVASAHKPIWDRIWATCPRTLLDCSGEYVGLPDRQMGNSEVGHMHLGAGRVLDQDLTRILNAIDEGDFATNPVLLETFRFAAHTNKAVHLLGLLSPGGVHSHEQITLALIEMAAAVGVERVYVHAFLDGRDTPPKSAAESIQAVMQKFRVLGFGRRGRIASIVGRFYGMDRNRHWDRTRSAYLLIAEGQGMRENTDPLIALDESYLDGKTDEFVLPTVIRPKGTDPVRVEEGDCLLFTNFRADRVKQLTAAFADPGFPSFDRPPPRALGRFVTLTDFGAEFSLPVAFPNEHPRNTFGEYIAGLGLSQLRLAETEKYAHVTYFFNGGDNRVFPGEVRCLVPSPRVADYAKVPEMAAFDVTDKLVEAIDGRRFDLIVCNYANADMVGHTGNFEAAVKAVEVLDRCLGRVVAAAERMGVELLITADHGNAEQMRSVATKHSAAGIQTSHTSNPVPFLYVGRDAEAVHRGSLIDVAPTMCYLLGLTPPPEMTGRPLLRLKDMAVAPARRALP
jgi:2,3-bisphosphoglycerate-independent phosphoglycerate mutase